MAKHSAMLAAAKQAGYEALVTTIHDRSAPALLVEGGSVRLPDEAIVIPREKLTHYLLVARVEDDKSKYLAQAGFTAERANELDAAIRRVVRQYDAEQDASNAYGVFYRVTGDLVGLDGCQLPVVTIWIALTNSPASYRFVTLKPARG